jgi:hypothetical protein
MQMASMPLQPLLQSPGSGAMRSVWSTGKDVGVRAALAAEQLSELFSSISEAVQD